MSQFARRRASLLGLMQEQQLDALLIGSEENRFYLSGFTGSAGYLLVRPDSTAIVADGRYWSQVGEQCPDLELVRFRSETDVNLGRAALTWLHAQGPISRLGIEGHHLSVLDFEKLNQEGNKLWGVNVLVPIEGQVEHIRLRKDELELERLRRSAQIADQALKVAMQSFRAGVKESEFCAELEYQLQKHGARKPSFDTIVASGPNGAYPHASVSSRAIAPGELVTLDFGCRCDSYCSDMTRTLWLCPLGELERKVYQTVRRAHSEAIAAVRPGIEANQLDAVARTIIAEAGFGDAFSHSLGHGIGLAVHEGPYLRSTVETTLEEGMVITIEPGIYLAGQTGCRVEDTVVVTASGCERITNSPYQELDQDHPLS